MLPSCNLMKIEKKIKIKKNFGINKNNLKVVILCGGLGSRLAEETKKFQNQWLKLGNFQF